MEDKSRSQLGFLLVADKMVNQRKVGEVVRTKNSREEGSCERVGQVSSGEDRVAAERN